ncbi:MAG: TRADD-N-associated membrane domain-containing protein [Chloroflexota bacterium]
MARYFSSGESFISWASVETDRELILSEFDDLDLAIQESAIQSLNDSRYAKLIEIFSYKKYDALYNKAIRSDVDIYRNLISGISTFHYEDAKDILKFVFNEAKGDEARKAAAEGLAKSKQGLEFLELTLRHDDTRKQTSAISAISNIASSEIQPETLAIFMRYRTHQNYSVRIECVRGLYISKNLTPEYLSDALQDENEYVRLRTALLISNIDSSNAKEYVIVFEDKKGYIVGEVLEHLEKRWVRLDEEALADAILKVLIVRETGRPAEYFNTEIVANVFRLLFKWNSRLYGETLKLLCDITFNNKGSIRRRAVLTAISLDERGFLAQVNENSINNPDAASEILNLVTGNLNTDVIANQISGTDPSDIQQNAANQIKLLAQYHESGLQQAKTSFSWALILSLAGFPFLLVAVYYLVVNKSESPTSIISAIGSVLVEFVAGTLFYLYNQTRKQLTYYHQQMNQIQRFLLANSVAESLDQPAKENARLELIRTIAKTEIQDNMKAS